MELTWKQLLQVMEKMTAQAQRLVDTGTKLLQAISDEKVDLIGHLVIEQEQLMKLFDDMEKERLALVQSLGTHFSIDTDRINAAALLAHVPPMWSNDYRMHIIRLKQAMDKLKQVNKVNQRRLQHSRQFTSWLINYLVTPTGSGNLYDDSGLSVQNSVYHVVNQNM